MKVNEFVNNNWLLTEFEKLDKKLYRETAHLSDMYKITNNENYLKIMSYGEEMVPILINRILNIGCGLCYYKMLNDIVGGINIPDEHRWKLSKMKEDYREWWELNKFKYGK